MLNQALLEAVFRPLSAANEAYAAKRPGARTDRQPVHTVYGGAQLFKADTAPKMGQVALRHLRHYAPDVDAFGEVFGLPHDTSLTATVYDRVIDKLESEPVEDFRIDFEDGFGVRTDDEEDAEARRSADEVRRGMQEGTLPPFLGIRIKPLNEENRDRAARTLDLFSATLLSTSRSGPGVPDNFVVTLPKVTIPEQVEALARICGLIESESGLEAGSLKIELMVETPGSILGEGGQAALHRLVDAADGRCIAAHFGVYDYTASLEISAGQQTMDHQVCRFARNVMQTSLAGTGIWISDGATNIMPVGPHRASEGEPLTQQQEDENREVVHRAWRMAFDDTTRSLESGFYQGWDLHPAQLTARYTAVYTFFLKSLDSAAHRLSTFVDKAAQATLVGDIFDDAATGQGLLNFFLRALNCRAITVEEAIEKTGLTIDELRSRSFTKIVEHRAR